MNTVDEHIGFLIHDVARRMRYRFDAKARTVGVTRPQWRLLFLVSHQPGETQASLANYLEVERITLCRMVDRLEEAGYVERRSDPEDRRVWRIFLTPAGAKMAHELATLATSVEEEMTSLLAPGEEELMRDALIRVREALSKRNDTPMSMSA